MRDQRCPLCQGETALVLQQHFGTKMHLPTEAPIRHCPTDNFLFVAAGAQPAYDAYYAAVANDTVHRELSTGDGARSPISERQSTHLTQALGDFFLKPRKVLDFGCGEAGLPVELALAQPASSFFGFEPGPAAHTALQKIEALQLKNLAILTLPACQAQAPYDCILLSHVLEHLLDLDLLHLLASLLADGGLLYVEVPDAELYQAYARREFLYYFDRLHVNHFTPQALNRLLGNYGMRHAGHFKYAFPYRDDGEYPALGMLFRKGQPDDTLISPPILEPTQRYIRQQKEHAAEKQAYYRSLDGVLAWGAGDNFCRSVQNGGPLEGLPLVLMDLQPRDIAIGERTYQAHNPRESIEKHPWPVLITVSEAAKEIGKQVASIDPHRPVFFV